MLVDRVCNRPDDFQRRRPRQLCTIGPERAVGTGKALNFNANYRTSYRTSYRIFHQTVVGQLENVGFQSVDT